MCTTARIAAYCLAIIGCAFSAAPRNAGAQAVPAAPPAGSSLLNPNLSVIGWFQGEAGDRVSVEGGRAFALREAELGFQTAVDPYSRADFFISVSPDEGADLEEGYLTLLTLPAGLSAKLGKFRQSFGRFNRTHPPETPFADRPLAAERFLGEEGLAGVGASASWLVPNPWHVYLNLDAEVTDTPSREASPAFEAYRGQDLLYNSRLGTFIEFGEATNLAVGASYANGSDGFRYTDPSDPPSSSKVPMRAQLYGADVTFRWKNPRRAIYRSLLVSGEAMERAADAPGGNAFVSRGAFAYVDYQFARRWHLGGRWDWSESLDLPGGNARGGLAFLTFTPSEFSLMSLQAGRHELEEGRTENRYYFKTTFNIGPHGAHPF